MSVTEKLFDKLAERLVASNEKIRAQIEAGFSQTAGGIRLQGARNRPIYANTVSWGGRGRLVGWSVRAAAGGSEATVSVHDGRDSSAELLATVVVPAGQASNVTLPGGGVSVTEAVFVAVTGATVVGSLYLGATD